RPGRAGLVAASLADLRGPARGVVELPLRLFWSAPDRTFDLDQPSMLQAMYEAVLREASRPDDRARYLHGGVLAAVLPELFLPKGLRRAWEDRTPRCARPGWRLPDAGQRPAPRGRRRRAARGGPVRLRPRRR